MCRTKSRESIITNRVREMKEILGNIEKSIDNFTKERLAGKLLEVIKIFLIEISDTEQHFKLNDELEEKEKLIESLKEEITILKKEASKKQGIAESLNQLLKSSNENLKRKIEELRLRLAETKNKLAQIIEVGLSEKVAEELDDLFRENQDLRQVMSSLNIDLKKSRAREKILLSVVKEKGEMTKSLEDRLEKAQFGEIEIGKNKIKIPILDFSILQYSPSSDDSEESIPNHPFKSDGNYKKYSLKVCQSFNDKDN
jgi:chromosome segregation ATPase